MDNAGNGGDFAGNYFADNDYMDGYFVNSQDAAVDNYFVDS